MLRMGLKQEKGGLLIKAKVLEGWHKGAWLWTPQCGVCGDRERMDGCLRIGLIWQNGLGWVIWGRMVEEGYY